MRSIHNHGYHNFYYCDNKLLTITRSALLHTYIHYTVCVYTHTCIQIIYSGKRFQYHAFLVMEIVINLFKKFLLRKFRKTPKVFHHKQHYTRSYVCAFICTYVYTYVRAYTLDSIHTYNIIIYKYIRA